MSHNTQSGFDLGAIKKILEQDANKYFKGVCNTDVDWFLRDSNIGVRSSGTSLDKDKDESVDSTSNSAGVGTGSVSATDTEKPSNSSSTTNVITKNGSSSASPARAEKQAVASAAVAPSTPKRTASYSSTQKLSPTPSHLQTTISNTNEHTLGKTKPSVAPIQEEIMTDSLSRTGRTRSASNPPSRRRQSTTSLLSNTGGSLSNGAGASGSGGFFSKLKGKFHRIEESPTPKEHTPSLSPPPRSENKQPSIFKENYQLGTRPANGATAMHSEKPVRTTAFNQPEGYHLTRTMSTPNYSDSSDPRLEEYINFYKQKDVRRKSSISRRSSVSSAGSHAPGNRYDRDSSVDSEKITGGIPIPAHPKNSPLPSALANGYENAGHNRNSSPGVGTMQSSPPSKISSFLKRRTSVQAPGSSSEERRNLSVSSATESEDEVKSIPLLPELAGLRPLKRVAFHSSTFLIDPPQQIPSRKPRKGNVEILANGQLKINPLSEEEKLAMEKAQMGQGGGIIVGGTGSLGIIQPEETEIETSEPSTTKDEGPEIGENGKVDEETRVDSHAKMIGIDKPMVSHHHSKAGYSVPVQKMALDMMYTRCCHLREILPIPAILKQIPAGSMAPIPLLQLRNPTPTMVEIQTFADFVRIAPIVCISLDGVSLSFSQFKVILSAMSAKKQLEKLSLRNTPIDHEGWSLLCWFLSRNTVINKLDITQCPSLSVNLLKKKKRKPKEKANPHEQELDRMTCNKENRSDMDWELFTATLVARGGIEELILTGCCITDTSTFESLIKLAASIKTSRLGLAYNNLSVTQVQVVVEYWLFKPFARGIDFGYNDFSSSKYLNAILKMRRDPKFDDYIKNSKLGFVSLNATNLRFNETFKEYFETLLVKLPNLKYLDLSNNSRLFGTYQAENKEGEVKPKDDSLSFTSSVSTVSSSVSELHSNEILTQDAIVSYFTSKFPLFPKLIRLHLENNNFSGDSIISIAKTLPFCKNLGYFSVHGNDMDLTSAASLLTALENSKTIIALDFDIDILPSIFKEKIGLFTMRNMERLLFAAKRSGMPEEGSIAGPGDTSSTSSSVSSSDSSKQPSYSLTEQLNVILSKKASHKLDINDPEVQSFIERAGKIRRDLKTSMNELFRLQLKNELNFEGKEMLIRFVFIESSIERGLQLIDPSLVDSKESFSSDYIQDNSAEDQRSNMRRGMPNDDDDENRGANLQINQTNTPISMSRTSSKSNLASLDKNEGSVLKLRKIHDDLNINAVENKGNEEFFKQLEDLTGEEIREKLLDADLNNLDKIIGYLGELKQKNISLEEVFNQKKMHDKHESARETNLGSKLNELQKTLSKLANQRDQEEDTGKENTTQDTPSQPASTTNEANGDAKPEDAAPVDDPENLMDAYDHVLNDLERRINN
ncbi:MAP-homologous protein 1 [[Candida] railenensis]|uniref:MAP-homologous protein 1 n=1 Tax=[Candida] railenensis TaxID=45579 RepID=A0A9P0QL88_9ASCO|nr:MAP-homologous protein 1 [[Candida] railenensis]